MVNFAARVVTGTRRTEHISPVLRSLGWLNVEDMVSERDCIRVFRALNDPGAPSSATRMFTRRQDVAPRDTRLARSAKIHLPKVRLASTQRAFSYRAAAKWNSLPEAVLHSPSIGQFRGGLKDLRRDALARE